MATNQQRREAAKRKLERQQERRVQQSHKRKRTAIITVIVVVVAVVVATVALGTLNGGTPPPASNNAAAAPPAPAGKCSFPATSGEPAARPVAAPSQVNPPTQGTVPVTITTSQGVLPITLNRASAPCTVESFVHLASAGFYNNTPCHRLVTEDGLKVLQCGDPTGTGTGGPGYSIPDEPPTGLKPGAANGVSVYPRGTLAMAKASAPNSGGSQFFLVYADSQLPPDYTIFGTVAEPGIQVLEKIGAAGDDGAYAATAGGGKPKLATTLQTVTVAQP